LTFESSQRRISISISIIITVIIIVIIIFITQEFEPLMSPAGLNVSSRGFRDLCLVTVTLAKPNDS
jgi:uncharacterized protein YpmB